MDSLNNSEYAPNADRPIDDVSAVGNENYGFPASDATMPEAVAAPAAPSQARRTARIARELAETIEVLQRGWNIDGMSVRPDHRMVAHTGFLTHARLLPS